MIDNMAVHESDEKPISSVKEKPVRPFYIQFARFISTIFSPAIISIPAVLLVALYHQEPLSLLFAAITLFFLSAGPMLYIAIGVWRGKFTDIDVSVRSQRTGPFLFGICSGVVGLVILLLNNAPRNLVSMLIMAVVTGIILLLITLRWKISLHASTFAGTVTLLTILYGAIVVPAFLLVVLVCWSRIVLKRHTFAQVTAGALLSMGLTLGIMAVRGH